MEDDKDLAKYLILRQHGIDVSVEEAAAAFDASGIKLPSEEEAATEFLRSIPVREPPGRQEQLILDFREDFNNLLGEVVRILLRIESKITCPDNPKETDP